MSVQIVGSLVAQIELRHTVVAGSNKDIAAHEQRKLQVLVAIDAGLQGQGKAVCAKGWILGANVDAVAGMSRGRR